MFRLFKRKKKEVDQKIQDEIKRSFKTYFDGIPHLVEPVETFGTMKMGITGICFERDNPGIYTMHVELLRPGILIGLKGRTIRKLENYLSTDEYVVKVRCHDSKLWD